MPTDDLSSVPGLEDKHLRALARQQVTDLRSFADADQRDIYRAMANVRPRPSLERISRWQEEARSRLPAPGTGAPDWQTVASFAVIFAQRQAGDTLERRVEVEQTEVEPEQEPQTWPGWDFEPAGTWMASQLQQAGSVSTPARPETEQPPARTQLAIETASIIAADRTFDLVTGGALAGEARGADRGADRAGPRGFHGERRAARNSHAGSDPHPPPGRTGLESPGPCRTPAFRPSRVRPRRNPRRSV